MRDQFVLFFFIFTLGSNLLPGQDLSFYVEQGKLNSPLIRDNKNQSEAAQLEADRLKALYTRAQVTLTGSYLFAPIISRDNGNPKLELNPSGTAENYSGYDLAASNGGVYQGLININQPLFTGSRYQTMVTPTLIGAQINENTVQLTGHDLEKFITDQYILCLQDHKQTEYLNRLIGILNEQIRITEQLVRGGIAKQSDLSLLSIELKTQKTSLNTFESTYRRDLLDLRVLCGIPDTTYQVLDDIDLQTGEEVAFSRFVERYRLDSLNLVAAQNVFELKYKPIVGAFANTGLNAVYAPTIANRFGLSAGINFTLNITDGRQRKISQKRTEVLLRSTSQYKTNFYNQNSVRKDRILSELRSLNERLTLILEQLTEYETLLEFYQQELSRGQISVVNYITILKNMAITQRDLVLQETNKELLINLYNYWNW